MTTAKKKRAAREGARVHRRPRLQDDRISEILDIAGEQFIAHGFEGASISEIARLSNSSKTTLYSRFPAKSDLFLAVLDRRMNFVFNQVATALPVDLPIEGTLLEYGRRLLTLALSPEQIALIRVVGMESLRFPQLGERLYELGPKRGHMFLSGYLAEQVTRGRLVNEDPDLMAEHLTGLLTSGRVRWLILGVKPTAVTKTMDSRIEAAVRAFLRAYGAMESVRKR